MSLNKFFRCQSTLAKFENCGYLKPYLDPFADWLAKHQFTKSCSRKHIRNIVHFSYFLQKVGQVDLYDLTKHLDAFVLEHIPQCTCKEWKHVRGSKVVSYSLNRFKKFMTACLGVSFNAEDFAYSKIHNDFLSWLSEIHYLDDATIALRSQYLKKFLRWYKDTFRWQDLSKLAPQDVEIFLIENTKDCGKSYKRSLQATLRGFFDFCYEQGYTPRNLRFSVPTIRTYRLSKAPKAIKEDEALKLLASIDRSTDSGKRNYAILILLYTYGVRGGQIRALKLDDIDWHNEQIHFPALKDGKSCSFPLTAEAGNSLLDYLCNVRKKTDYRKVFLTLRAPFVPMTNHGALSQMVRTSIINAQVMSPNQGSHCFRHAFVSRMLKHDEPFKYIADMLGHKYIQTTFIYTKIDFSSLAEVALELPEVKK